jgi:hypothetical protein
MGSWGSKPRSYSKLGSRRPISLLPLNGRDGGITTLGHLNTTTIMVRHSFAPLVVLVTALYILQAQCTPVVFQKRGICATEDPDPSFLSALGQVQVGETRSLHAGSEARHGPIEIETWFHIVASKAEAGQVTNAMINSQVGFVHLAPAAVSS